MKPKTKMSSLLPSHVHFRNTNDQKWVSLTRIRPPLTAKQIWKKKTSIILQKWFGRTNEERKPTLWQRWADLRLSEWLGMASPLLSFGPFLPLFLICSSSFVLFGFYMVGLFKGMVVLDVYVYGVAWLLWIYEGVWRNCFVVVGVRM